jgi:hypothetical protein
MKENNIVMKNLNLEKTLIYIILSFVFLAGLIVSPLVFLSFLSNTNIFSGDGVLTAYCVITTFAVTELPAPFLWKPTRKLAMTDPVSLPINRSTTPVPFTKLR